MLCAFVTHFTVHTPTIQIIIVEVICGHFQRYHVCFVGIVSRNHSMVSYSYQTSYHTGPARRLLHAITQYVVISNFVEGNHYNAEKMHHIWYPQCAQGRKRQCFQKTDLCLLPDIVATNRIICL